jgi:hypothetical protein
MQARIKLVREETKRVLVWRSRHGDSGSEEKAKLAQEHAPTRTAIRTSELGHGFGGMKMTN